MNQEPGTPSAGTQREELAAQLRHLEGFVARSKAEGTEIPPEAVEMLERLREIVQALEGLSSTFDGLDAPAP